MINVDDNVSVLKGVGKKTAENFLRLGIERVYDLIYYFPRDYEVFEQPKRIVDFVEGEMAVILASINSMPEVKKIKNLSILNCQVRDGSGIIKLTWFNQPYLKNTLFRGHKYIFRGKAVTKNGMLVIEQPKIYNEAEYEQLLDVLQPVYPLTQGVTNNALLKGIKQALDNIDFDEEHLPKWIIDNNNLISKKDAFSLIHFPETNDTMLKARRRLVFDEFFEFILSLSLLKEEKEVQKNTCPMEEMKECSLFVNALPYNLTKAQEAVWEDIKRDMSGMRTMNRLIQGDVGSGKTIIAVLSLMMSALNGFQGCLMAPTEVLARQHYEELTKLLKPYEIKIELLTGSMTATRKRRAYERIQLHMADIIVGTHALIQDKVQYAKLGLVITDEQHRFGVKQRIKLSEKGNAPHVLVMSATPIPRTLAMILYGDLDISVIDELPSNRLPVKTCVVDTDNRKTAYKFIEKQIKEGRQAYVICPMVDESESIEAENVIEYTERLKEVMPEGINIEYLHGKMNPMMKNDIMESFTSGKIHVLISTTVIEVGVNVPNASVIVIENAERFGLAQLHQLRGRVGRGEYQSYCVLISGKKGKDTLERLEILNKSNDGFYIASEDLKIRGPGDLFGIKQSGDLEFKLGDIYNDSETLKAASEAAKDITVEEREHLLKKNGGLSVKIRSLMQNSL